jgi:hypothetical protein
VGVEGIGNGVEVVRGVGSGIEIVVASGGEIGIEFEVVAELGGCVWGKEMLMGSIFEVHRMQWWSGESCELVWEVGCLMVEGEVGLMRG